MACLVRRRTPRIVLALLVLLAAVAVAVMPAAARQVQLTPVKVAILPLEPTAQAIYAKHRGMFRKQGLDVQIELFTNPGQTGAALLSGDVDFIATHLGQAAKFKSDRFPVKIVAAGATYDPKKANSSLVAAPGRTLTRARDLVGKTIALDDAFTIAGVGTRKWLETSGVDWDDVNKQYMGFPLMLGPLLEGRVDAAFIPEPYRTMALEQGAKRIANPFQAVCTKVCLLTFWIARANVDQNLAARFRNAIQKAAVWANNDKNDQASGKILAKYVDIDPKLIAKMTRTTFATRLRVSLAKPWLDVYAEFGYIPSAFKPADLVK
jgi:NitT/TauT family transport system substrate-binding protein